jgi:predicted nucleic acid-binding protein
MITLDTNVISEIMRPEPNPAVLNWLDAQYRDELFISAIVKAEIEMGIAILDEGKRKQTLFKAAEFIFINFSNRYLAFDEKTASHYAAIIAFARKKGRPISVEDALIAATALQHSAPLATRNVTDFDFLINLELINPWEYEY